MIKNRNLVSFFNDVHYTLKRQPFWRHRLMQLLYEFRHKRHLSPYLTGLGLKKHRYVTFGPRYPGWEDDISILEPIEFMAKQWTESEKYINRDLKQIPDNNKLHVCYEKLVQNPDFELRRICEHIGIDMQPLKSELTKIYAWSVDTWKNKLDAVELRKIDPIIHDTMNSLGYKP